jgi:hypothetical protein
VRLCRPALVVGARRRRRELSDRYGACNCL